VELVRHDGVQALHGRQGATHAVFDGRTSCDEARTAAGVIAHRGFEGQNSRIEVADERRRQSVRD